MKFFGNFPGGFFWRIFFDGIILAEFFGRIFFGRILLEEFFLEDFFLEDFWEDFEYGRN